jgi:hypothetical protein
MKIIQWDQKISSPSFKGYVVNVWYEEEHFFNWEQEVGEITSDILFKGNRIEESYERSRVFETLQDAEEWIIDVSYGDGDPKCYVVFKLISEEEIEKERAREKRELALQEVSSYKELEGLFDIEIPETITENDYFKKFQESKEGPKEPEPEREDPYEAKYREHELECARLKEDWAEEEELALQVSLAKKMGLGFFTPSTALAVGLGVAGIITAPWATVAVFGAGALGASGYLFMIRGS